MLSFIKTLLQASAWPIQTPEPYSAFHILLCAAGIPLAVFLARRLARTGTHPCGVLFICGLVLAVSELYKQGFLYFVAGQGRYNWWYFPFQLCSVPMYLCLILPLFKHTPHCRTEKCICTFMQDFALLGGVMALAEPSGLMHPYLLLTLHGFLWHFMLIFIGLYCAMTGLGGRTPGDFVSMLPLFLACICIATFINVASHPYGNADMFYISPYYPNGQIVFHQIALTIGTAAGNLLYLAAMVFEALSATCPWAGCFPANRSDGFRRGPPPAIHSDIPTFCHADFLSCGFSVIQKAAFVRYPARPKAASSMPSFLNTFPFSKVCADRQRWLPPPGPSACGEASPKALWSWDGW